MCVPEQGLMPEVHPVETADGDDGLCLSHAILAEYRWLEPDAREIPSVREVLVAKADFPRLAP